jgi:hypothetical protein
VFLFNFSKTEKLLSRRALLAAEKIENALSTANKGERGKKIEKGVFLSQGT